jgi:DNA mismatch endonuclease (patch repair protein)
MDPLSPEARSARMAKVRSKGNASTEAALVTLLREASITGWRRHPKGLLGNPDFYFPKSQTDPFRRWVLLARLPGLPKNSPQTRASFWQEKIDGNRRRDNRKRRKLRALGYRVFRIWEHALRADPVGCLLGEDRRHPLAIL